MEDLEIHAKCGQAETVKGSRLRVYERLNRKNMLGKEKFKGNISEKRAGKPTCIPKKYSIWRPLKIKKNFLYLIICLPWVRLCMDTRDNKGFCPLLHGLKPQELLPIYIS